MAYPAGWHMRYVPRGKAVAAKEPPGKETAAPFPGGNQQALHDHLNKHADAEGAADLHILGGVGMDLRIRSLNVHKSGSSEICS